MANIASIMNIFAQYLSRNLILPFLSFLGVVCTVSCQVVHTESLTVVGYARAFPSRNQDTPGAYAVSHEFCSTLNPLTATQLKPSQCTAPSRWYTTRLRADDSMTRSRCFLPAVQISRCYSCLVTVFYLWESTMNLSFFFFIFLDFFSYEADQVACCQRSTLYHSLYHIKICMKSHHLQLL